MSEDDNDAFLFATWMTRERISQSLSKTALAEKVGVSVPHIHNIEIGKTAASPSLAVKLINAIADNPVTMREGSRAYVADRLGMEMYSMIDLEPGDEHAGLR